LQQLVHQYHWSLGSSALLEDGVGASKEYGAMMQGLERGRWEVSFLGEIFGGAIRRRYFEREATVTKKLS
jgi:hypothetical protein